MLLFYFLFFLNSICLASEVYYSSYTAFSPYQEEYIESSDTVNVKKETRFLWYKENKILNGYKLYNNDELFDINDCYNNFTDWDRTILSSEVGKEVETRTMYRNVLTYDVKYIDIYNIEGGIFSTKIPEITILFDDKPIEYNVECEICLSDFDEYINNGIVDEFKGQILINSSLKIDLLKDYPVDRLKIIVYFSDSSNKDKGYTLLYSNDSLKFARIDNIFKVEDGYESLIVSEHKIQDVPMGQWTYIIDDTKIIDSDNLYDYYDYLEYRYKEKYCQVYTNEILYNDVYSKNEIGEYTNKSDISKDFYSYQKRDKLELNISEINVKEYDLNNFIVSSTGEYKIFSNIDYNKNGVYQVNFSLNDIKVTKDVIVNISSNNVFFYEREIEKLNNKIIDLEKELFDKINDKNNLIEEKEKILKENLKLNEMIVNLENLNLVYEKKIKELENNIHTLNKDIANTLNNKDLEINNCFNELNNQLEKFSKLENKYKEEIENNDLNKYILKINNYKSGGLLIILLLLLFLMIYKLREKSNKKNV